MEEIAFGEMGMLESEFNSSTPRYWVRRLNGLRAYQKRKFNEENWRARRVAYLIGQWKRGTKEDQIWRFDEEIRRNVEELEQVRDMIESTWSPVGDA